MLLIYTTQITNRLLFTCDFIFKEQLGIEYRNTTDKDEFLNSDLPRLNYSTSQLKDEWWIRAAALLFETGIRNQELLDSKIGNTLATDPFSSIFFLLSRYEEYYDIPRDQYGRYNEHESVLVRNELQQIPVVDQLVIQIRDALRDRYPELNCAERKFSFIPTYDIDIAYNYKVKGFWRNAGGFLLSILRMDSASFNERARVLAGNKNDPYDTFEWLDELHQQYKLKPVFFFLVGDYGRYDKNISYCNPAFRKLIKNISDKHEVGIHPSYRSNYDELQLKEEIKRLEDITGKRMIRSRQHFLKMTLPLTYRQLIQNGITDDHTMGFASSPGFRAGTSQPFFFYDLSKEEKTALRVHPFAIMDASLFYYLKYTPQQAMDECKRMVAEVKKVNGTLSTLWHNNFLSEWQDWRGWSEVYTEMIKEALR